jgi:hypothetical protein
MMRPASIHAYAATLALAASAVLAVVLACAPKHAEAPPSGAPDAEVCAKTCLATCEAEKPARAGCFKECVDKSCAAAPPPAAAQPAPPPATGGCAKDNDCKGDRVCDKGQCVAPR